MAHSGRRSVAIILPGLGAESEVIRISGWLIDVGDLVDEGDRVVEVSLPGITFDVAAPAAGMLVRIEKAYGAAVNAGDVLGWIEAEGPADDE